MNACGMLRLSIFESIQFGYAFFILSIFVKIFMFDDLLNIRKIVQGMCYSLYLCFITSSYMKLYIPIEGGSLL